MRLRITYEDGYFSTTTLRAFCKANIEDAALCRHTRRLRVGESFTVGGGAAPLVKISRVRERHQGKSRRR